MEIEEGSGVAEPVGIEEQLELEVVVEVVVVDAIVLLVEKSEEDIGNRIRKDLLH